MASVPGHHAFRLVLDMIIEFYDSNTDEEIAVGPQGRPQTVNATGPGIWSDAVHRWLGNEHRIYFDENKTVVGETHIGPWDARNEVLQAGNATILPVRSFGMNSGGYQLRPEHSNEDIFVRHAYLGSWKRQNVPVTTTSAAPTSPPTIPTTSPKVNPTRARKKRVKKHVKSREPHHKQKVAHIAAKHAANLPEHPL
jgi:hypothetical protein